MTVPVVPIVLMFPVGPVKGDRSRYDLESWIASTIRGFLGLAPAHELIKLLNLRVGCPA